MLVCDKGEDWAAIARLYVNYSSTFRDFHRYPLWHVIYNRPGRPHLSLIGIIYGRSIGRIYSCFADIWIYVLVSFGALYSGGDAAASGPKVGYGPAARLRGGGSLANT